MKAPDNSLDAALPANVDAERTILGAVLLDNDAWGQIRETLRPADFSIESHRRIITRMRDLAESDCAIDIVTLANELGKRKEVEHIGGVAYLASLTEGLPRRPVISEYIKIVKEKSMMRGIILACSVACTSAGEQVDPPLEVASALISEIERIAAPTLATKQAKVESFVVETSNRINEEYRNQLSPCIPSGNTWFDHKAGGYRYGKFTIVGARPKIGKTGWAVKSAAHNLKRGTRTVIFSLEMEKDEMLRNLVPHFVEVRNRVVNKPWLATPEQIQVITKGLGQIAELPLSIYDGKMDCDEVCWTMDREIRDAKGEEVLFILDHFGLMGGSNKDIRQRYVENSARLRDKIKHKRAALVVLFQLNPVPRQVEDKRPISDDIKESKNPLEDCYACILLHRYRDTTDNKLTTKANINLDLIRGGGSPGNVDCNFDPMRLCFEADAELIDDDAEPSYFQ